MKNTFSTAYFFLTPALVLYAIFFVFPFFFSIYISFSDWNLISNEKTFVGLENYIHVFKDVVFWKAVKNTITYVLVTVPISVLLGLIYAVLIESAGRARNIYRFLFFIPVVLSVAATSLSFSLMYSPQSGLINQFLHFIGIDGPSWLQQQNTALLSIMIVGIWQSFGYNVILYIAGLKRVDKELYEAAEIDGASKWNQFVHITFPMLSPVHLFVFVVTMIYSFQVFSTVQIMTMGGPNNSTNVLVFYVYQEAFQFFSTGYASAAASILFIIVLILTIIQVNLIKSKVHYQ